MQDKDPIYLLSPTVVLSPRPFPKASSACCCLFDYSLMIGIMLAIILKIRRLRMRITLILIKLKDALSSNPRPWSHTLERLSVSLSPSIPASFSTYVIKYWIIKCVTTYSIYILRVIERDTCDWPEKHDGRNSKFMIRIRDFRCGWTQLRRAHLNHWPSAKRFGRCDGHIRTSITYNGLYSN